MRRWYFFDLDGTVTDSKAGILNAVRHALAAFHIERPEAFVVTLSGDNSLSPDRPCYLTRQLIGAADMAREYGYDMKFR